MELQDLKATWISMGEDLDRLSKIESSELHIKNPIDVKDTLRRRFQLEIVVLVAAIFILGTSRYWAPVKMPVLWISTFCLLFIVGIVATAVIIRNTSRIDLGSDSHVGIMKHILNIKRFYRNMELYGTISAGLLMVACDFLTCFVWSNRSCNPFCDYRRMFHT